MINLQDPKPETHLKQGIQDQKKTEEDKKMASKKTSTKKLKENAQGQATLEYVIISSLIGIFCLFAIKKIGVAIEKRMEYIKTQIVKNIPMNK